MISALRTKNLTLLNNEHLDGVNSVMWLHLRDVHGRTMQCKIKIRQSRSTTYVSRRISCVRRA